MFHFSPPVTLRLPRGGMLSWRRGPVRLRVLSGLVWITQPNDLHDHFLDTGQSLELNQGFIGAECDSQISFEIRRSALASAWLSIAPRSLGPFCRQPSGTGVSLVADARP